MRPFTFSANVFLQTIAANCQTYGILELMLNFQFLMTPQSQSNVMLGTLWSVATSSLASKVTNIGQFTVSYLHALKVSFKCSWKNDLISNSKFKVLPAQYLGHGETNKAMILIKQSMISWHRNYQSPAPVYHQTSPIWRRTCPFQWATV